MPDDYEFIFVGGCGRSGTSLVQKLLVAHSRIAGGPEFDHTEQIVSLWYRMTINTQRLAHYVSTAEIDQIFGEFYRSFFTNIATGECTYVSEKTPRNIRVADKLLRLFPRATFINVIRDGRDVLASYLDVRHRYQESGHDNPNLNARRICRMWNDSIDMHFRVVSDEELNRRYHTVRFEEMVITPDSVIGDLCTFLGLALEERLLHPETITAAETGMRVANPFYPEEMYQQPFNPAKIGRWRNHLSLAKKLVTIIMLRRNLNRLGYL